MRAILSCYLHISKPNFEQAENVMRKIKTWSSDSNSQHETETEMTSSDCNDPSNGKRFENTTLANR